MNSTDILTLLPQKYSTCVWTVFRNFIFAWEFYNTFSLTIMLGNDPKVVNRVEVRIERYSFDLKILIYIGHSWWWWVSIYLMRHGGLSWTTSVFLPLGARICTIKLSAHLFHPGHYRSLRSRRVSSYRHFSPRTNFQLHCSCPIFVRTWCHAPKSTLIYPLGP